MRFAGWAIAGLILPLNLYCAYAQGASLKAVDTEDLPVLVAKAAEAQPKDQCFLYAEVVHRMTELAGHQLSTGDSVHASATLAMVQQYADRIHFGLAPDQKRVKNAQLLMQRTSFLLTDILNAASLEDRKALQATLAKLEQVQTELMMQVFKK